MQLTEIQLERVWSKVNKTNSCWLWMASKINGYGQFKLGKRHLWAHRLVYQLVNECLLNGLDLHHLCENKACVNPEHLKPMSHSEHMKITKGWCGANMLAKTHCPQGHPYSGDNLVASQLKRNKRVCRTCFNENMKLRKRLERKRA